MAGADMLLQREQPEATKGRGSRQAHRREPRGASLRGGLVGRRRLAAVHQGRHRPGELRERRGGRQAAKLHVEQDTTESVARGREGAAKGGQRKGRHLAQGRVHAVKGGRSSGAAVGRSQKETPSVRAAATTRRPATVLPTGGSGAGAGASAGRRPRPRRRHVAPTPRSSTLAGLRRCPEAPRNTSMAARKRGTTAAPPRRAVQSSAYWEAARRKDARSKLKAWLFSHERRAWAGAR